VFYDPANRLTSEERRELTIVIAGAVLMVPALWLIIVIIYFGLGAS
jgi:hypothetical protein